MQQTRLNDSTLKPATTLRVLITGANGQLGYELKRTAPEGFELLAVDIDQLDITAASAVNAFFKEHQPDAVINAAAYTAVDKAETDRELAYAVNATGPRFLAQACADAGIPMVQVSTDFVFDGNQSTPYQPEDKPSPISVYGDSKLKGEQAVTEILGNKASIIRTAWVYSAHGNNFVKTMLRLMAEKDQLGVVADQIGTPTRASSLAQACWNACLNLMEGQEGGMYHWTDAGAASWYDFAEAIQEEAIILGMLDKRIPVNPIPASAYPTPAKRPSFSVLDKTSAYEQLNMKPLHWRHNLRAMLEELKRSNV
ncbi:dTDP-4-dehydrorhamnose reductase [Endozoicomonas atrinae]|uniref:dTDP-4-dehydrorhamnose reductase n=1 Tax=Endozoicomonas atrinae TaxID=1333660 RepID=UPI000AF6B859|nr:dTDP-4-dehydrorhamnose reductase [Endozoicomonas atrinae]